MAKAQAAPTELQQYVSLRSVQNKGLKRYFREVEALASVKDKIDEREDGDTIETVANSIKGSKKRRLAIVNNARRNEDTSDQDVVGFEVSLIRNLYTLKIAIVVKNDIYLV